MKILRVAFSNLNSLSGRHEIDLSTGPLAAAGIFAITGPTGAGKSTILDAITLALYGRAARYGNTPSPADMMSRHAGECSAEVVFEVPAGRFRAAWHLKRARKQASGRIQPAKRYLYDAQEQPLAEKLTEVNRQIEALIGLDADRFLRSVLLAQNDFARFLKADANERAMLLESLTGTEIYSRLGKLAYEYHARKEQELRARRLQLDSIPLMEPAKRTETLNEIAAGQPKVDSLKSDLTKLRSEIQLGERLEKLQLQQEELNRRKQQLEQQWNDFAASLQRWSRHKDAVKFRVLLHAVDDVSQALKSAESSASDARLELATARARYGHAIHSAIAMAERLDAQLIQRRAELRERQAALQAEQQTLTTWLRDHADDGKLSNVLNDVVATLNQLMSTRQRHDDSRADIGRLDTRRATAQKAVQQGKQELTALTDKKQAAAETLLQCRESLQACADGKSLADVERDIETVRQRRETLKELKANVEQYQEQSGQWEAARTASEKLAAKRQESAQGRDAAIQAAARQAEFVEALRDSYARGQLVAELEDHRANLKPGEACPLCGALEHPYATSRPVTESALQREAKKLQDEIATSNRLNQVRDKAKERHQELAHRLEEAKNGCQVLVDQLASTEQRSRELALACRCDASTVEGVGKELDDVDSLHRSLESRRSRMQQAKEAVAAAELAHAASESDWRVGDTKLRNALEALAALERERVEADQLARQRQSQVEVHEDQVRQLLTPFLTADQVVPAAGCEDEVCGILKQRAADWVQAQQQERELAESLRRVAEQQVQVDSESGTIAKARQEYERLAAAIPALPAAAKSAPGPSLAALEALSANWEAAWNSQADADRDILQQRSNLDAASATFAERQTALKGLEKKHSSALASLDQQLAETPFASVDQLREAMLTDAQASEIENAQQQLRAATNENKGQLTTIAAAIAELLQANAPRKDDLQKRRDLELERRSELEVAESLIAELRFSIQKDDAFRQQRETQARAIKEELSSLESWGKLRSLIGSADGKKFRLFAQGLSLDVLVRLANRHLVRLTERYRLQRIAGEQLDLEIVDLHQAGVRRPMASLSGGESFVASLALALGLADLAGRNVRIDSLFIDEGFGSLDPDTLDVAVAALEGLQNSNKTIGVISHVELLKERIATQIRVTPLGGGVSQVTIVS